MYNTIVLVSPWQMKMERNGMKDKFLNRSGDCTVVLLTVAISGIE